MTLATVAVLALPVGAADASVLFMGGGLTSLQTVRVGNPGNTAEWSGQSYLGYGPDRLCGTVDYAYNIGRYEVTAGQYTEFLNAVAGVDTYDLYSTRMATSSCRCMIQRTDANQDGLYEYSVPSEWANRPVSFVSWGDAARFANWVHNGQPLGAQGLATTEDGAYYLNGATSVQGLLAVTRNTDWRWSIPTEDEWYKAAYHRNDGLTGNYWDYPTGSDAIPINAVTNPDGGNNANFDYTINSPYYRTRVGEFESSRSPYGTYDQGGNVWEWNESIILEGYRGIRGGAFDASSYLMHASNRDYIDPSNECYYIGFRLCARVHPGDCNYDGKVNIGDLGIIAANWGATGRSWNQGDFNGDGLVNIGDLGVMAGSWGWSAGSTGAVPEPASLLLLLLGAMSACPRRRQGRCSKQDEGLISLSMRQRQSSLEGAVAQAAAPAASRTSPSR